MNTSASADSDLLMLTASVRRAPVTPERDTRSLPAKSTRDRRPKDVTCVATLTPTTSTCNNKCEREDVSLSAVLSQWRLR
jgi:hypothetical protein